MFIHYKKTHLEHFVEKLYINHSILKPEDITIQRLSTELDIHIDYAPVRSRAYESITGMRFVLLDNRITPMKQRFDFLHELCHMLRHAGNQMTLPVPFIKAQEEDAEKFVLYATMPFFMIQSFSLSGDYSTAIQQISNVFGVSREMAKVRFDQILRREYEGEMLPWRRGEYISHSFDQKNSEPSHALDEPVIFAYYDPHSTLDGPDQLIVCLDHATLSTQHEWIVPMEERFKEIEIDALKNLELESASRGDLICFDGQLTLQIHQLVYRHGLSKRNFVLQMRDIEQILEADQSTVRRFL
ncbi:ImmA/IrrE family metallo-endopeptidase [Paenibacillus borealis]|uniref:ImmA/IrrE family metallo-endopeptidase n=1 Tax=Paenibacillus borealis TaxID=160799 RepID=UPI000693C200|nr:ImmA/IrrE family metallo-endopeptidase [Paenibacillus borealis]